VEIIGIDIGFGFTKATNGRESLVFKSVLGEATELQFREQILVDAADEEHLQVEVDGKSYFVGELAERQSNVRFFTLDQAQFISSFAKSLALSAAARLVGGYIPVNLVTGLPIGHYRQHKDELARILQGEHKVAVTGADGKREEKTVNVNKVRVIPQPFGSLFNMMLNDLGDLGDKRLVREKIGIIDVGFRTSDYTVSDKMRYSERGRRAGSMSSSTGSMKPWIAAASRSEARNTISRESPSRSSDSSPRPWPMKSTDCGWMIGTWTPWSSPAAAGRFWPNICSPCCTDM
jgi:plasmid segregation protein ParM